MGSPRERRRRVRNGEPLLRTELHPARTPRDCCGRARDILGSHTSGVFPRGRTSPLRPRDKRPRAIRRKLLDCEANGFRGGREALVANGPRPGSPIPGRKQLSLCGVIELAHGLEPYSLMRRTWRANSTNEGKYPFECSSFKLPTLYGNCLGKASNAAKLIEFGKYSDPTAKRIPAKFGRTVACASGHATDSTTPDGSDGPAPSRGSYPCGV